MKIIKSGKDLLDVELLDEQPFTLVCPNTGLAHVMKVYRGNFMDNVVSVQDDCVKLLKNNYTFNFSGTNELVDLIDSKEFTIDKRGLSSFANYMQSAPRFNCTPVVTYDVESLEPLITSPEVSAVPYTEPVEDSCDDVAEDCFTVIDELEEELWGMDIEGWDE